MDSVIATAGLTKYYGRQVGIEDLDLDVHGGEVFGFLGPNGAGKTTTIRLLLGLLRPTRGSASVLGMALTRHGPAIRARTGYVPGDLALYERMTGEDLLRYFGRMRGGVEPAAYRALAARFDLDLGRRVRDLSKGNKQKLGVIQAFMHEPDLLVLDEPTSGLDPLVQLEFHRLVRETVERGATVFLSSHVLAEVEQMADRVGIVSQGRLVVVDSVDGLRARARRRIELDFPDGVPPGLRDVEGVLDVDVRGGTATCWVTGPLTALLAVAVAHGVVDLHTHDPDLEDAFLGYVEKGVPAQRRRSRARAASSA
ncbi:MAG: ABC transporter ATP-binding protein [Actinomycetota bacterium]